MIRGCAVTNVMFNHNLCPRHHRQPLKYYLNSSKQCFHSYMLKLTVVDELMASEYALALMALYIWVHRAFFGSKAQSLPKKEMC